MEASASPIEPGRVIGEAFRTYQEHAVPLLGGAVIVIGSPGSSMGSSACRTASSSFCSAF